MTKIGIDSVNKLTIDFLYTGMVDYWGGDSDRWKDNCGCVFALNDNETTLRDLECQILAELFDVGTDFDLKPAFDDITSSDIKEAYQNALSTEGKDAYKRNTIWEGSSPNPRDLEEEATGEYYGFAIETPVVIFLLKIETD